MSQAEVIDFSSFAPNEGGRGVNFSVTDTSAAQKIPGTANPGPANKVAIQNYGDNVCFVRMGPSTVTVSASSGMVIMPGIPYVLTIPPTLPSQSYIAAICPSGLTTTLSVTGGDGS
jgi:hypothetical protein